MLGVQGWSQVHVALPLLVSVRHGTQGVTDAAAGAVGGDACLIHHRSDTCPRGVAVRKSATEQEEEEAAASRRRRTVAVRGKGRWTCLGVIACYYSLLHDDATHVCPHMCHRISAEAQTDLVGFVCYRPKRCTS